jgi:hypothetical protein
MGAAGRMAFPLRVLIGILGISGILVGLFLIAVASFADGSTSERVVTIAIAVGSRSSAASSSGSRVRARSGGAHGL